MDIDDTQDELLVDYDDGDAPMREDDVETGDAEMIDEEPIKPGSVTLLQTSRTWTDPFR